MRKVAVEVPNATASSSTKRRMTEIFVKSLYLVTLAKVAGWVIAGAVVVAEEAYALYEINNGQAVGASGVILDGKIDVDLVDIDTDNDTDLTLAVGALIGGVPHNQYGSSECSGGGIKASGVCSDSVTVPCVTQGNKQEACQEVAGFVDDFPANLCELGRRRRIPLYMCFIDLQKAYDSVDRELLWKVLARAGIPGEMIAVIRKCHVGMRARVCMDDGELSDWFPVTQGLRQGCSLSPPLFNVFFVAPLESAEGLARMMTMIVEVFREFGLTVSERKTEILVMRVKEKQPPLLPPPPLIIEAAGQRPAYSRRRQWRHCYTAARRDHYRLMRTTHHQLLLQVIGHLRKRGIHRQLSCAQALKRVGCQSVEVTICQRRLFFAGAVARQPDKRLPKRLTFDELAGGEKPGKGSPEQNWLTCLKDELRVFGATHGSTDDAPRVLGSRS
eukprot:g19952.t1